MLYKQCPFLVPFFMPPMPGQTQQEYLTWVRNFTLAIQSKLIFFFSSRTLQNAGISIHRRQNRTTRSVFETVVRSATSLFGHFDYETTAKPTKSAASARLGEWMDLDVEFLESRTITGDLCNPIAGIHSSMRFWTVANVSTAIPKTVDCTAASVHGETGWGEQFVNFRIGNEMILFRSHGNLQIDTGGPNARLKVLIGNIIRENRIQPPSGTLAPNFW